MMELDSSERLAILERYNDQGMHLVSQLGKHMAGLCFDQQGKNGGEGRSQSRRGEAEP